MRDRVQRINSFMLSPGMSVIFGLIGLVGLWSYHSGWLLALVSLAVAVILVYNVKARALFKGQSFPVGALFLLLQAASPGSPAGCLTALVAAVAMAFVFLCFSRPGETKAFFLIFLFCGIGALGARSFLLLAVALMPALMLVRAFSMRGLVASLLGLVTPLIILGGFGLYDIGSLEALYGGGTWRFVGFDAQTLFSCGLAVVFALAMFLPAYGYPAKARARGMAILGLTACVVVMPFVDSVNAADCLPLVNVCAAYNAGHFAATKRFGWIAALLVALMAAGVYFYY